VKLEIELTMTVEQLAQAFCDFDDDHQAKFFVACAKIAETWEPEARISQWRHVSRHLRDCACSSVEAREMVVDLGYALTGDK
jgi:hypothetical protein